MPLLTVPDTFRQVCADVRRGRGAGYGDAARVLVALLHKAPGIAGADVAQLRWHLELCDDDAMLAWFDAHCPECMALVPVTRRGHFRVGVYIARGRL